MTAPPRSRCRSAVADAIPARWTGTEAVSACDAGVPANPTPSPIRTYASATPAYDVCCFHSSNITMKPRRKNTYPDSKVNREPRETTSFADSPATATIATDIGMTDAPEASVL